NRIVDISRKSDLEFWVASLDLGFGIFNLQTKQYNFFNTQSKLLAGQSNQASNGLYRDPAGLLWIFNFKNGISLLSPASNIFDYTPLPSEGCQNANVNEPQDFAWNAARRELYVVTGGCQGLYVYEPVRRVEPVHLSGQSPFRLKYSVNPQSGAAAFFQRMLIDRQGRVWVGAQPAGRGGRSLYRYDPGRRQLLPFSLPGIEKMAGFPVNDLAEDHQGNIWVATTRGGIFRLNFKTNEVEHFLQGGAFDGARMQVVDLICMTAAHEVPETGQGASRLVETQIWFSTREAGVFCFHPDLKKFMRYGHQPGQAGGLAEDHVVAIEGDPLGNIWVATASRGLQLIPVGAPANAVLPHFTVKDGLAFNSIHRLAWSPDGQLWIATEKGISVFNPEKKQFKTYDEGDGLADAFLDRKGFRWCASGEIFVGQAKGFYSFQPDEIYLNNSPPVLAFTGFDLFGKPFFTGVDLNNLPELRLRHDQNFFTLHFAALSFSQSNRNEYRYRLEGIDPGWIEIGNRAEVSYTRVPPGHYRFRVRARNSSKVESLGELSLPIVVTPAFYQTWWFQAVLAALALSLLVYYFRSRLARALERKTAENEL
ncbi:MAG: hypothetical protein JNK89_03715, partial [Saprospiraceae bacterium]|nr:hypothetical protein [Saprospiraceae bacterium]